MITATNAQLALARRQAYIEELVAQAEGNNKIWVRAFWNDDYANVVRALQRERPSDYGFRGFELWELLDKKGLCNRPYPIARG